MNKLTACIVGLGGYSKSYLKDMNMLKEHGIELIAAIDPSLENAVAYPFLKECGLDIPLYSTMEDFYKENKADIAIIVTGVHIHKQNIICAFENGSHVMTEKPLVPTLQEMEEIKKVQALSGKKMAVGFQWCYDSYFLEIKKDILNGKYGKPLRFKVFLPWGRNWKYYSNWTGNLYTKDGGYMLDSIISNATSHYIMNEMFLTGATMDSTAIISEVTAELYRSNDITSFDTDIVRCKTSTGVELMHVASHAIATNENQQFLYEFENGTISFNYADNLTTTIQSTFSDGTVKNYGEPNQGHPGYDKMMAIANSIRNDQPLLCTADTVSEQIKVVTSLLDFVDIVDIDRQLVIKDETLQATYMKTLRDDLQKCFDEWKLPSELGFAWASPATTYKLEGYKAFEGRKLKKK